MKLEHRVGIGLDPESSPSCECMVCDLPEGADHGPVAWKVLLWFPGPYPHEGEIGMLLCSHCKGDWVDGQWDPPNDNVLVLQVMPV